jgi:hypothetical protein
MLEVTESMKLRVKADWEKIAKEELSIEATGTVQDAIYAYGSELACLRLEHAFRFTEGAKADFSKNLNTWYFRNK